MHLQDCHDRCPCPRPAGADLRSKTRVLSKVPKSVSDLPMWNYDGSSTGQVGGGGMRAGWRVIN